jgi:hypothetical protein
MSASRGGLMNPHATPGTVRDPAPGSAGLFYNRPFAVVDSVEVCFRQGDAAANLRAAAAWLEVNPGWFLRTLWYEHHGALEMAQLDDGPHGVLWLIAEHGSDDEPPQGARRALLPADGDRSNPSGRTAPASPGPA